MIERFNLEKVNNPGEATLLAYAKLNELVDAVNELKENLKPILEERESGIKVYEEVMPNMKPADPYAEQRKWIGKLCRFRDNDCDEWNYGILKSINNIECSFPFMDAESYEWAICEPVKTDNDIIFKGE